MVTYNANSLRKTGAWTVLAEQFAYYNIAIAGIQEARPRNSVVSQVGNYWCATSAADQNHNFGLRQMINIQRHVDNL